MNLIEKRLKSEKLLRYLEKNEGKMLYEGEDLVRKIKIRPCQNPDQKLHDACRFCTKKVIKNKGRYDSHGLCIHYENFSIENLSVRDE